METVDHYLQGENRRVLPKEFTLGAVHLKVAEPDRSIQFYEGVIGLQVNERSGEGARLGVGGDDLIVLHQLATERRESRHSGLYHVALLYPTREELARVAQRIQLAGVRIDGASDHGTHEAIYLPDPDGNGLELAWDRSPERWPNLSDITAIAPKPLDIGGLFNLVSGREPEPRADPATRVGHLHLHVGDIAEALHFYRELIGFDLITEIDTAAFVSAGGYHHHLAFNTWQGLRAPPASPDAVGLVHWTIELPTAADVIEVGDRLKAGGVAPTAIDRGIEVDDPSGNRLRVVATAD
jgi:catechol 2,3-dioxygenase